MGSRLPHELLEELKSYLQHFDQTGHLVETDAVAEIKRRLCQRIAEVEALVRMTQSNGVMKDTTYRPGQGAR